MAFHDAQSSLWAFPRNCSIASLVQSTIQLYSAHNLGSQSSMINMLFMDIALLFASQVTPLTATLDSLFGFMCTSCRVFIVTCFPFKDLLVIHYQYQTITVECHKIVNIMHTVRVQFFIHKALLSHWTSNIESIFFNYGIDVFKTKFVHVQMTTLIRHKHWSFHARQDLHINISIGILSLIQTPLQPSKEGLDTRLL